MSDFVRVLLFSLLFLAMFVFWAAQCSAQSTFTRDKINTTTLTVLGSEKLYFSTDSTTPPAGSIKLWARDVSTLYLIKSDGTKVNLLSAAVDTSILATQYDISLKSVAFGTIDTSGLAVNKILKWNGSAWVVRDDSSGGGVGVSDSTTWIATDYDVSLKLSKTDTLSLSNRINTKLAATDTASLSARIGARADSSTALYWADTTLSNGIATDFNLPVSRTDTVNASLDTLLVTVSSVSSILSCTISGTGTAPPMPVRFYQVDGTKFVIKFDYDLTVNQPVTTVYRR
jgi:hypothetical protein